MTTTDGEREQLISAATTAHRARGPQGEPILNGAWLDLDASGRREAFARTLELRALEAALDARGRSSTVKAVLARLR
jgi:hypothetical protein